MQARTIVAGYTDEEKPIEEKKKGVDGVLVLMEQEPGRAQVAVQTLHKLLTNIHTNPEESKFRKIKTGNAAFRTKVAEIHGGLTVLEDIGFMQETIENESQWVLGTPASDLAKDQQQQTVKRVLDQLEVAMSQLSL